MRLLLDTHLLLWAAGEPGKLSPAARDLMENPAHSLLFSAASLWEISIKAGLGRADFQVDPPLLRRGLLDNDYEELPLTSQQAVTVGQLPDIHRDPFDRILIAQARTEGIALLSHDSRVQAYGSPVIPV